MKVTSIAPVGTKGRAIYVEIEDADIDDGVPRTIRQKFQKMSMAADLLVVEYLKAEGEISDEFARQRIHEIGTRYGG